jgi:phytoene dehydrogenase-like protein
MKDHDSILIIGAGFAGLAAGIYAQVNGYKSEVFEMHNQPGGLCTSWKRKGYTIDGCIHWLVGSSPKSGMHDMWEEVGVAQGLNIINIDEYINFESPDGRKLIFYTDINRLEKHLLEFSPQDEAPIRDFISGVKMCLPFDSPSKHDKPLVKLGKAFKMGQTFLFNGRKMKRWLKTSASDFAERFSDPLLRDAFREMWLPGFSMFFMLFTFAFLHNKNAGYPLGGSMPMSEAMAKRYVNLGGKIQYKSKVGKILTENDHAIGIRLSDGSEHYANRVISAADGYSTIYKMLGGKYGSAKTFEPYEKWEAFPALIYVGVGVTLTFDHIPHSVSGTYLKLKKPVWIGNSERKAILVHVFNHDPSMAPEGKTTIIVMMYGDYDYWKNLAQGTKAYNDAKNAVGTSIAGILEERFPGIAGKIEMIDVATPVTFERYTGNWKGSFEGWQITPENSGVLMKKMPQTLPGLKNFYMCGQWVEPGGGLPTGVMSGRRLIKAVCKEDRKKFRVTNHSTILLNK